MGLRIIDDRRGLGRSGRDWSLPIHALGGRRRVVWDAGMECNLVRRSG